MDPRSRGHVPVLYLGLLAGRWAWTHDRRRDSQRPRRRRLVIVEVLESWASGKRHTELIAYTDEQLLALIRDPNTPADLRRKAIEEAKFRGLRNVQKRSKR